MRTFISLAIIIVLSPVVSYLTGIVIAGHDSSQLDTVGDIQLHGFPVWFYESAPGYSILRGWHFDRFLINTCVFGLLLALLVYFGGRVVNRRTSRPR